MIISKRPDGTASYSGVAFDFLDYNARALNIRKVQFLSSFFSIIDWEFTILFPFHFLYSYEYVFLNPEEVKKYGNRIAQLKALKNDVWIQSDVFTSHSCIVETLFKFRRQILHRVAWFYRTTFTRKSPSLGPKKKVTLWPPVVRFNQW